MCVGWVTGAWVSRAGYFCGLSTSGPVLGASLRCLFAPILFVIWACLFFCTEFSETIRERIAALLDSGSRFDEIGRIAGSSSEETEGSSGAIQFSPGNFVLGTGPVKGRIVVAAGEDFTMSGGSPNLAGLRKSVYTETLALELQCPLVRLHEGSGGSVGGGRKKAAGAPGRPSTSGLVSKPLRTAWRRCPCAPWRLAAWPGFRHSGLWPRIFLSWCVLPRC